MLNPKLPPIDDLHIVLWHRWSEDGYRRPLQDWLLSGPKEDPLKEVPHYVISSDGRRYPLHLLPIRYRNHEWAQRLILWRLIPEPWPDYIIRLKKSRQEYEAFRQASLKRMWKDILSIVKSYFFR